ncbi:class I SAM-dependent methyltransferase [Ramlibacter albus]|uniref:Class I SAM-dependent methyltransferase n=1 Tax=Ramlibacter albus TaxID=2079448 RepID=A0A923M684_9BURK|nr:class I SAM-dependent methyltransferase [Ramlibacter albus]MBC5763569.1 class I SAM-dependent methyltransferase [Ramlibacter albus]
MLTALAALALVLASTALFFFVFTRAALLVRTLTGERNPAAHVYPVYSNMRLIKMVDFQPVISAILLFQYHRLVSMIVAGLRATDLRGKTVLITSCAFGDVIPRVTAAAFASGAERVVIVDLIENELIHAKTKLAQWGERVQYLLGDATAMTLAPGSVHANIMFFLLHELPHAEKTKALAEATRLMAPGGTLYLGEFHKPKPWVLKALSWTYFKVFEPLGLALWDWQDPVARLNGMGGWRAGTETCFFGNFQVVTAARQA